MSKTPDQSTKVAGALSNLISVTCLLFLLCGFLRSARASLIAYDGFDYPLNQTVYGLGTNAGWPTSGQLYTISSGSGTGAISEVSDLAPYLNLITSGNQLHLNGTNAPGGNEGVFRNLGVTYNTAGNIYWFSVLVQIDNGVGASYAGISLFSTSAEQFFYGQRNASSTWGMEQHAGAGVSSGVSATNSANGFLVIELDGTSGDATHRTAKLYVNPTSLGGSAPVTPTATLTFSDFSFNRFRTQAGNENFDVDELRFGTSYADVTPNSLIPASFSGLTNRAITYGTPAASVTIGGKISGPGSVYPVNGDAVSATINGKTGTGTVTNATGDFSITYNDPSLTNLPAATYSITYQYAGNGTVYLSSATDTNTSLTVNQATSGLTLTSSLNPAGYRAAVDFTASLFTTAATGTVIFETGGVAFSTNTVGSGSASSLALTNLSRGTNPITAIYSGDANLLAGTNTLNQVITNHPPAASVMTVYRNGNLSIKIRLSDVAANWTDSDGDTVDLAGVALQSTNGIALTPLNWATNNGAIVAASNAYIGYANTNLINDQVRYSISDTAGGTNTGTINILFNPFVTGQTSLGISNGVARLTFFGIPGFTYVTQRATNLNQSVWEDLTTNILAAQTPIISVTDSNPPAPTAYYRLKWQP